MQPSDDAWIRACLDDHPEAFRNLVERHQLPLLRYLAARSNDAEQAAEVAQEAFVRAYFALRELRKPDAFFPWLVGIADRVAKENHRAAKRCRTVDFDGIDPEKMACPQEAAGDGEVAAAVARLPATYREVIQLRYFERRSCAEISSELGVPLGTVTKRLSRAYALLRERLAGKGFDPESEVTR
jgi:RNA polymerase sigma-70 factor (ECF subfamily)